MAGEAQSRKLGFYTSPAPAQFPSVTGHRYRECSRPFLSSCSWYSLISETSRRAIRRASLRAFCSSASVEAAAGASAAAACWRRTAAILSDTTGDFGTGALSLSPNDSIARSNDEPRNSSASDLNGGTAQIAPTVLFRTTIGLKYDSGSIVSSDMISGNAPFPRLFHNARPSALLTYRPRPAANP